MSNLITVLIPCKNEIDNLQGCITAARACADEILVADSGSTDGTLELAHQLADRVIQREYIDSGDFKNWGIPQAKHEWVLIVDADERVTPELAAEIRKTTNTTSTKRAFEIPRRNFFLGHALKHGDWASDKVTRLIRRDCRYALHTDHAEVDVAAHELGLLRQKLVHYTAWDLEPYLVKMHHYAAQQAELWYRQGKRPSLRKVVTNGPLRFLRGYVLRAGFMDGMIGFFISALTGYYSFLKQFMLWQRTHGRKLVDMDAAYAANRSESPTTSSNDSAADSQSKPGIRPAA